MKIVLFSFIFSVSLLFAAEGAHGHLPYAKSIELVKSIQHEAIVLGSGDKAVYVFVDPLCPHSRKFISMVSRHPKMLSKYRYYIFLYSIPRLHSEATVAAIYASPDPVEALLEVMVDQKAMEGDVDVTRTLVSKIARIAEKIDVYKRPYLIMAKQH